MKVTHLKTGDSQLVPMSTRPMSTRTNINAYTCQLVPPIDVNSHHKWCQLVPQVMSTRTQQGRYQMMVRADISYYNTTYISSYPCQLIPMSTRTTYRCQLVPSSNVNSYQSYFRRIMNVGLVCVIYVLQLCIIVWHVQLAIQFIPMISSYKW